ncbi:MAG TPA: TMEM165/GDT1 family protein [Candidatus Latescibacteria bacterium]|nr:TMEM165/GDT1 family protein [Candidatus Latescibacterota bacterium]
MTDIKALLAVFWSVFLAELGDKTQIATFCFASQKGLSRTEVFLAAASALVVSSLAAVVLGAQFGRVLSPKLIRLASGMAFIGLGIWVLWGLRA